MVPDPTRTSLGLEYFLWDKDEEWNWSNDRLIELGIRECAQIGLIDPTEIEDGTVVRMKKAYPVYDQKYYENLAILRQYLETFSNLQTIGRNGLHRYNNQDHSMLTGIYAARNIVGEKYDVWSVNTEMEYHEESRVEKTETSKKKVFSKVGDTTLGDRQVPTRIVPATTASHISPDEIIEAVFAKLDPLALGTAVGIVSGLSLFLATIILLLKGGFVVGPNLSLLRHYFLGFRVTWSGAFIGLVEAGIGGFILGYLIAWLRNWGMRAYAFLLKKRAEAEAQRRLLDDV